MQIKEWIEYQNILQKIENIEFENKNQLERLKVIDFENSFNFMSESSLKLHRLSMNYFLDFKATNHKMIKIKNYWIEIYSLLCRPNELDYGDYDEISELHEQINIINEKIEKTIYTIFLQSENCPPLIQDWMSHNTFQQMLLEQEKQSAREHIAQIIGAPEESQLKINHDFIIKDFDKKLELIKSINCSTPEFSLLLNKKTQLFKLNKNMNLNRITNLAIESEFHKSIDEITNEISTLERFFFRKTLNAIQSTLSI